MAKYECELHGGFSAILNDVEKNVMGGSLSASKEDGSDFTVGGCRCAVRVYERYSMLGSNRVSLSVTLLGADGRVFLSAITSGGSQAMFFKLNTMGEESFLNCIRDVVTAYQK